MIREFLADVWELFTSSYLSDKVLGILMGVIMMLVAGFLATAVFYLADSVGISSTNTKVTVVSGKNIRPAHTTTTLVSTGKTVIPIIQNNPESYELRFRIDDEEMTSRVEREFFDQVNIGDRIEVYYGFGRLSGWKNVVRISSIPR